MKKYKFLALTDHSGHSSENSIYALMKKLSEHEQCDQVYVASRGNSSNDSFFKDYKSTTVNACLVDANFGFEIDGKSLMNAPHKISMLEVDVIILRLPRPVEDAFLNYLNSVAQQQVIVNHPMGILKTSTKAFLLNFPEVCPPMQLCRSAQEVLAFAAKFPIVLKPLKEYGGKGIVKIEANQVSSGHEFWELETYLKSIQKELETEGFLAMKFLKNVNQGDKRILVSNGQILATSLRLPAPDSWMCNVAQGGTSVPSTISPEEELIIQKIAPVLLKEGIVIFGADTLVGDDGKRVLSEINTLSIGGFPQCEVQTGKPVVQQAMSNMVDYVNEQFLIL